MVFAAARAGLACRRFKLGSERCRSWFAAGLVAACLGLALPLSAARAQVQSAGQAQPAARPAANRAAADDQEARDLFKLGKQAFDEGRFERALKYFQDAYELSGRAALLSNIGTVLDRLRRDGEALAAYQRYLKEVPDAANRRLIEERVRIIEGAMQRAEAEAEAAAPATDAQPVSVPTPAEAARTQAERDQPGLGSEPVADRPVTARWWFWAGIGTVAAAAVVVGLAASSGGGSQTQGPALVDTATRVREL